MLLGTGMRICGVQWLITDNDTHHSGARIVLINGGGAGNLCYGKTEVTRLWYRYIRRHILRTAASLLAFVLHFNLKTVERDERCQQ